MKTNNTTEVKVTPLAAAIHAQLNPAPAHTNSPPRVFHRWFDDGF